MNPDLDRLQPYPFEKLAQLKRGINGNPDKPHIALSIGEPQHEPPAFVLQTLASSLGLISRYPLTRGSGELRQSIVNWLNRRFSLPDTLLDANQHVLPVNGTREALFSFAQAVINRSKPASVLMPNPFYQIYEGAAFLAGAEPVFYNTTADTAYLPDFDAIDAATWEACQLLYICTPGNPTGSVIPLAQLQALIDKARQYDFIIASDECYSEIYIDEQNPPPGLLQAAVQMGQMGHDSLKNCVVFHSLSKRSNLPGMRSGFVAGDASVMDQYLKYRTYHGNAMPPAHQAASISAWDDEAHVQHNRELYRQKFQLAGEILSPVIDVKMPDAGFYLWLQTPMSDTEFTRELFAQQNITILPGQYLSREANGINPGQNHVRMALVAGVDETREAASRIREFIERKL